MILATSVLILTFASCPFAVKAPDAPRVFILINQNKKRGSPFATASKAKGKGLRLK
jgi:hypothetical protein